MYRPSSGTAIHVDLEGKSVSRLDQCSRAPVHQRRLVTLSLAVGTVTLGVGLMTGTIGGIATAAPVSVSRGSSTLSDPAAGHPYRHGAVPLRDTSSPLSTTNRPQHRINPHPQGAITEGPLLRGDVSFGGGSVVTGSPKVYLVFWGSRWGTQSTGTGGYSVYSGDPDALAPHLQAFFDGLGTNNEAWSAILTQYCQGVPFGTKTCPLSPSIAHVAYPSATVLGGVWEDTSANLGAATGTQIAQEAANAAVHFSNPPGAQYVIVSPTGTDPDQWLSPRNGYCAYHDNTMTHFSARCRDPTCPTPTCPTSPMSAPSAARSPTLESSTGRTRPSATSTPRHSPTPSPRRGGPTDMATRSPTNAKTSSGASPAGLRMCRWRPAPSPCRGSGPTTSGKGAAARTPTRPS